MAQSSVLVAEGDAKLLKHGVESEDEEVIEKAVTKAKQHTSTASATTAKATTSAASSSRNWVPKQVKADKDYTAAAARALLPNRKGCTLHLDEVRFTRWSISYPRVHPPLSITKSYGARTGLTMTQALFHCLKQIWVWHAEETGEVCPYEFVLWCAKSVALVLIYIKERCTEGLLCSQCFQNLSKKKTLEIPNQHTTHTSHIQTCRK